MTTSFAGGFLISLAGFPAALVEVVTVAVSLVLDAESVGRCPVLSSLAVVE